LLSHYHSLISRAPCSTNGARGTCEPSSRCSLAN
jgi:hypothetical protein